MYGERIDVSRAVVGETWGVRGALEYPGLDGRIN
jgi:hypothetical protein